MSMRLGTQTRYAVRAMLDLASHYHEGTTTAKDIACRQEMSARYLENLLAPLRAAGLVRTQRGNRGGYLLGKDPSEISIGQIVKALEGTLSPISCVDDPRFCHRASKCATRKIWCNLHEVVVNFLDGIILSDMIEADGEHELLPEAETDMTHFDSKCLHPRKVQKETRSRHKKIS